RQDSCLRLRGAQGISLQGLGEEIRISARAANSPDAVLSRGQAAPRRVPPPHAGAHLDGACAALRQAGAGQVRQTGREAEEAFLDQDSELPALEEGDLWRRLHVPGLFADLEAEKRE